MQPEKQVKCQVLRSFYGPDGKTVQKLGAWVQLPGLFAAQMRSANKVRYEDDAIPPPDMAEPQQQPKPAATK